MRRSLVWLAVVLVAVVGLTSSGLVGVAAAQDTAPTCSEVSFSVGDGSADSPYEIENVSQLQCIEEDLDAHYELVSDINASETSEWNGGKGFEPIGSADTPFAGSFDGNESTISELSINRPDTNDVGLFAAINESGSVREVSLQGATVTGNTSVGSLAGSTSGQLTGAVVTGADISGTANTTKIGGLTGANQGDITQVNVIETDVNGTDVVGGVVGWNDGGNITEATSNTSVRGRSGVGGLIGISINNGTIRSATVNGTVQAEDVLNSGELSIGIGGVVGSNGILPFFDGAGGSFEPTQLGPATGSNLTAVSGEARINIGPRGGIAVGGVTGLNYRGKINSSTSVGDIQIAAPGEGPVLSATVGGMVGVNIGTVEDSSTTTDIISDNPGRTLAAGGAVGAAVNAGDKTLFGKRYPADASSRLSNVTATGDVQGVTLLGGLVGMNGIAPSSFIVELFSPLNPLSGGTVTDATATGSVSAVDIPNIMAQIGVTSSKTGGLVGENHNATIARSESTSTVTGTVAVGGLVGTHAGSEAHLEDSYATGNVAGNETGGLVGVTTDGTITQTYATGNVTGDEAIGGLVGNVSGYPAVVNQSYAAGKVTGDSDTGGRIGKTGRGPTIETTYWDTETTGQEATNQYGVSTGELTGYSALTHVGEFDFDKVWSIGSANGQVSYPTLRANPQTPAPGTRRLYDGGNGTLDDAYTIANWSHLNNTRENLNANFTVTNDLTEETDGYRAVASPSANDARGFVPISGRFPGFTGSLDGQGHAIENLTINRTDEDDVGLFKSVNTGGSGTGTVRNLDLVNVDIAGGNYTGAVAGTHSGARTIENISITGYIDGDRMVGGVVGSNAGHVRNVSVDGTVNGSIRVGGVIGENPGGTLNASSAVGTVTGDSLVGGLVGDNSADNPTGEGGTILNSHAGASVEAYGLVGGLVGANGDKRQLFGPTKILFSGGTISNSSASGTVAVTVSPSVTGKRAGGLVGQMYLGNITRSSASGTVDAQDATHVGGLVGYADGTEPEPQGGGQQPIPVGRTIRESYAIGDVTGNESVGGLVGTTRNETIVHSYAVGNVTGDTAVGGLVGNHTGTNANVTEAYAAGTVSGGTDVGGLIGTTQASPTVESAYWDTETAAQSSSEGGTDLNTSQLKANESLAGFDFQHTWDVVDNETHSSYPYLLNNTQSPPPGLHELAPTPGAGGDGNDDRDSGQSNEDSSDSDDNSGNGASTSGGSSNNDDDDRSSVDVRSMAQPDAAGAQDGESDVAPTSTTGFVVSMRNVDGGEQIAVDFTEQRRPTASQPTDGDAPPTENEETPSGESAPRNVQSDGLVLTISEEGDYELTVTARDVDVFATAAESGDGDAEPSDGEDTDRGEGESSGEVDLSTDAFDEESTRFVEATSARPVGFITVEHTFDSDDLETATHRFRVRKSYLAATGATAESVALYREEPESYRALSTRRVGEDDAYYYFEADTPGFSTFVIGTEAPIFDLGEPTLEQADVETGVIDASVPVENIGTEPGTYTVRLRGDGVVLAETEVSVPAGETVEATVRATVPDADGLALTIAGESLGEFTVEDSDADGSERTTDAGVQPTADAEDATDEPSDTADGSAPGGRFLVLLVAAVLVVVAVWALRRRDEP